MDTLKNIVSEQKDLVILLIVVCAVGYFSWGILFPVFFQITPEETVKAEAQRLLENFSQTNQE